MATSSDGSGNGSTQRGTTEFGLAGAPPPDHSSDGSVSDSSVEAWWDTYKREADMSTLVDDAMDLAPVIHAGRDLHRAARLGDVEAIDELVRLAGVDPNTQDFFNATPLYLAAYCGHRDAVVKLLSLGARCDPGTFDGERAVYGALTDDIARVLRHAAAVVRQRGPLYADLARLWQAAVRSRAALALAEAGPEEVPGIPGEDSPDGPVEDGLGPDCLLECAGLPANAAGDGRTSEASGHARPDAGEVPVHAVVAAAGSPVIRRLATAAFLATGRHPTRIVLPSPGAGDVGAEALAAVAEFLYTDRVTLPRRLLAQGVTAAEGLGLDALACKLREQQGDAHDGDGADNAAASDRAAQGRKEGKGRKGNGRARGLGNGFARSVQGSVFVTVDLSPASYVIGSVADEDGLVASAGDASSSLGPRRGVTKKSGVPWFKSVPSATCESEAEAVLQVARRRQHRAAQRARRKMARALGGAAAAAAASEEDDGASTEDGCDGVEASTAELPAAPADARAAVLSPAAGPDPDPSSDGAPTQPGHMVASGPAARFLAWRFSGTRQPSVSTPGTALRDTARGAAGSRAVLVPAPEGAGPSRTRPAKQARVGEAPTALRLLAKPLRRRLCDVVRANIPPGLWKRRHAKHAAPEALVARDRPENNHLPPDVVLEAAGVRFGAHRKLLMARSPFFRTMMCSGFAEGAAAVDSAAPAAASGAGGHMPDAAEAPTVELAGMSPAVVAAMLMFAYTDELLKVGAAESLPELLLASDLFDMKDLRAAAVQKSVKRLSWANLAELFRIAEALNNAKLAGACSRFVALGLDEAVGRRDFAELVVESAMAIQSRDAVDSIPIVDAVRTEIQLVFGNPAGLLPGVASLLHASPLRGGGVEWVATGKAVFQPLSLSAGLVEEPERESESVAATFDGLPTFDYASASFSKPNFRVPSDGPEAVRRLGLLAELLGWLELPSNLGAAFK